MYSSVVYARAVYRPDVLPLVDEILNTESISTRFSVFDDAAGTGLPGDPADQTVETVGLDQVYRIERTAGTPQEGFLYIKDEAQGTRPYAVEVKLDLAVVSVAAYDYVTYPDFTGVMVGLIYWPKSKGVFLFFRDDGTKRVTVAGPSSDGIGTRTVEVTTIFDWSADIYTYKISWDETGTREKVLVLATDSAGDETVLAEISIPTINEFLNSVALGGDSAEDPPNSVVLVVGTDGSTVGDYVDIYKSDLFRFGASVVIVGGPTGSADVIRSPIESVIARQLEDFDDWVEQGEGELRLQGIASSIARDPVLGSPAVFNVTREEPDLVRGEWMIIAELVGLNSEHLGTFNTAMGLDIEDGVSKHTFRMLDNFIAKDGGILDSGIVGAFESYFLPPTALDWTSDFRLILIGSTSRGTVRAYLVSDEQIDIDTGTYVTSVASTATRITLGFLEDDFEYYGSLNTTGVWVFVNCTFFEPLDGTFPEVQGWTRAWAGATRSLTAENRLLIESNTLGFYDIYSFADPDYTDESGAMLYFKGKVTDWTDASGAVNPPRQEFGPIAYLDATTVGAQLRFVESETGKKYVFVSSELDDVADVLAQNEEGRLLSAEFDFTEDHVYLFVLKPFHHIRLYVDYLETPIIDVPWASKGAAFRTPPTNLPAGAVVAFGSLGENAGVRFETAFARASIGTGYDFVITPTFSEEDLVDHIYGSEAEILVDFEDVDP